MFVITMIRHKILYIITVIGHFGDSVMTDILPFVGGRIDTPVKS